MYSQKSIRERLVTYSDFKDCLFYLQNIYEDNKIPYGDFNVLVLWLLSERATKKDIELIVSSILEN